MLESLIDLERLDDIIMVRSERMGFLSVEGVNLRIDHFNKPLIMHNTHVHSQYELYFCPEDISQTSVINGVEYTYKYPCAILSTPYTVHSMSCHENAEKYERYVFYFGARTIDSFDDYHLPKSFFGRNTGLLFRLSNDEANTLVEIVRMLNGKQTLAEKELIFALFMNKLVGTCPDERIEKVGTPSFYIQDVLQYISENFAGELNSEDISKRFAVSRSKLDRDFKKFTGITVHGYVEMCRLNQAKYLLEFKKEMSVGDIAVRCGFENENYFFPFFKKSTGMTPAEYRKSLKKETRPRKR